MSTSPSAATCASCSTPLHGWTGPCRNCGYASTAAQAPFLPAVAPQAGVPVPAYPPQPMVHVVSAKSPGVAVLLSFIWLGAGHLYVGRIGLGIAIMVFEFFLVLFSLIPFSWFLTVPVWLIAFVLIAINVSNEAKAFNARNGILVR
jgi:TM2 domain-containing membrane protein YozV